MIGRMKWFAVVGKMADDAFTDDTTHTMAFECEFQEDAICKFREEMLKLYHDWEDARVIVLHVVESETQLKVWIIDAIE